MPCGPVIFNEVGLVRETNKSFIGKTGLLLARVVVQPNSNIIPLRVANFSTEPVKVYKNTIVSTFEPVDIETLEVSTVSRVNCAEIKTEVGIPDHLKCVFEKSSKDLDNIEVKKLKEFLCSYQDVFSKSPSDIGHTEIVNHKINTGNAKPIKLKPYRLPLAKREVAERDTRHGIKGIIEPSSSAWCSPVVMVETKKKTKPLHQLTEKCKKFEWTEACNCSFEHLKKLLISAPILGYPINDGGFILDTDASNVGMGAVLSQIQDGEERVIGYFSKTFSKSERNYCVTRKELLTIVSAVKNFHHYLYGRSFTVRTDHGSLRWLVNFKNPEGQLARWLETLGAYNFQIIHRPGRIHSNADALSRRPCPDDCSYCSKVEDKFSNVGLGEVEINNEISTKEVVVKSVVVDDTNTLSGAVKVEGSQRLETSKKKEAAQVYASYRSDDLNTSKSCTKHENESMNIPDKVKDESGFALKASYDVGKSSSSEIFNVPNLKRSEEMKGKSRSARETSVDVCKSKTNENILNQRIGVVKTRSMKSHQLDQQKPSSSSPMHDEKFVEIDFDLENEQENDPIRDGILCRKWESERGDNVTWQKVIPENLKECVLKQLHNSVTGGHLGIKKTLSKVRQRFFWFGVRKYIENWCSKCDVCASRKRPNRKPKAPMRQYNVGAPLERVAIDIMRPLPRSIQGNNFLLVIGDYFTKFVHAIPLKSQEAEVVARTLVDNFISIFGVPLQIHTDQGANFESQLFQELCKLIDIDKTRTTVMRPQSDGMAERFMRTLENMLSSFVSNHQKDWDKFVPVLMMAYRSAEHENLLFGKSPDGPKSSISDFVNDLEHTLLTVHEFARTNLNFASDVMKKNYDHNIHLKLFNPGDLVWYYQYQRKSKWMCVICEDMTFEKRWFLERHILERHSDFAWKCPECKNCSKDVIPNHGCKVHENQMICFQNSTGRRGKEAEEDLEKFKRDEMPKKIKLVDNNGMRLKVASRRNRYARSEIGDTSNRSTCNSKRGSSLKEKSRKRTGIENKENNNISGPTPAKS
ncbi:unnamed protein product [Mytilus coruscus]|uniref:Integrase catalytic domain-containing protein n=1 Tax=Mytilus coruscus TaxID=42192 RepID=A0A6J8AJV3_MYTCO|nr:unnamed protein product [Mytilus coruscus]